MSNRLSSIGALGYQGTNAASPPNVIVSDFAPAASDYKNHAMGDFWLHLNRNVTPYISTPYMLTSLYQETANWFELAVSGNAINTITGNVGTAVGADGAANLNIIGSGGITVTGNPGINTLTISSPAITWNTVTTGTEQMAVNQGYIADNAGGVTLTLPVTGVVGNVLKVVVINAGGVTIAQNAGQTVHWLEEDTTTGVGGSFANTENYASMTLLCTTTDTDWVVIEGNGNWTVV